MNDFPKVVNADQVLDFDNLERHAEGIHPESVSVFWIPDGDVTGCALGHAQCTDDMQRVDERPLPVFAFLFDGLECGRQREDHLLRDRCGLGCGQIQLVDAAHVLSLAEN